MTIDEMIAVLQAAKEGKTIVYGMSKNAADIADLCSRCDFRVKPEPMELKVWVSPNGVTQIQISEYATESYINECWTLKTFREVV